MAVYLALKETWRNKGRFLLVSLVVTLITVLVLFIAGLSEGLAAANRELIEKLNGEVIVFQEGTKLSTTASRIGRSRLAEIRRVDGVEDAGQVGFASAALVVGDGQPDIDVALIGVEPGSQVNLPPSKAGRSSAMSANEVIIDTGVTARHDVQVGDTIQLKVTQGIDEKFYDLTVVGITDRRQYFFQPAVFAPMLTWDKIRPQAAGGQTAGELVGNIAVVKLQNPDDLDPMAEKIQSEVDKVEA